MDEQGREREIQRMYLEIGLGDPAFAERFRMFDVLRDDPPEVVCQTVITGAADIFEGGDDLDG